MGSSAPVQSFDIEVFRSSAWFVVQAGLDRRLLGRAIDTHLGMAPKALRVVRRVHTANNLYQGVATSHFWRTTEIQNLHEDLPGFQNQKDLEWRSRRDLEQPLALYLLRQNFGVFLRSRGCTVFDLLYDGRSAAELVQNWQITQAALQPIASFQSNILGGDAPTRLRDLVRFFDNLLKNTVQEGKTAMAAPIEHGGLGMAIHDIQARFPEAEHHDRIMTRLCASLPPSRNWQERLSALLSLLSHTPTPLEYYYIDRYLAELVHIDSVVLEPTQGSNDLPQQVINLRDWVYGQKIDHQEKMLACWQRYNQLARSGILPWTRDALRLLLLKILRAAPAQSPNDLVQAIVEIDVIGTDIDQGFACWRGDPEIQDCLEQRISWLVNRDNIQRMMIRHRQPSERLSAVASMFSLLRRLSNRDRFAGFIEEFIVVPALLKELETEFSGALPALPTLLRFAQRLEKVDINPECRQRMFSAIDSAICQTLEKEIVNARGKSDIDRTLGLLRVWLPSPLTAGKCRTLAQNMIGQAVTQPDFFNAFLDSYKHEKVRQRAAESLDELLIAYGFKAPARV